MSTPQLYFEDFAVGEVKTYGPRVITREEIVAFAAEFDPQPMHLDEEAARLGMLGGLAASGWHTCSLMMRLICDGFVLNTASMGSPGVDAVKWLVPVRPGDSLSVRATVLETRASNSRPDRGFVTFRFEVLAGAETRVMTLTTALMILRRLPGATKAAGAAVSGAAP